MQLTCQGRTKGTLISHLSIAPLTIINQALLALSTTNPKLTETLYSFTVLALIHTSVAKVYSLSVYILSGQHKGQSGAAQLWLICTGVTELSFVCNDQVISICWFDNEVAYNHVTQQQHCNQSEKQSVTTLSTLASRNIKSCLSHTALTRLPLSQQTGCIQLE